MMTHSVDNPRSRFPPENWTCRPGYPNYFPVRGGMSFARKARDVHLLATERGCIASSHRAGEQTVAVTSAVARSAYDSVTRARNARLESEPFPRREGTCLRWLLLPDDCALVVNCGSIIPSRGWKKIGDDGIGGVRGVPPGKKKGGWGRGVGASNVNCRRGSG